MCFLFDVKQHARARTHTHNLSSGVSLTFFTIKSLMWFGDLNDETVEGVINCSCSCNNIYCHYKPAIYCSLHSSTVTG